MPNDLYALPIVRSLSPAVTLRQQGDIPLIVITHQHCQAIIALQGAQLLQWQPDDQPPVLWLSPQTAFQKGQPIRGGIPFCWPWFGQAGQPAHGFARNKLWTLISTEETEREVSVTLQLKSDADTLALWPHDFTLTAQFHLGNYCDVMLEAQGDFSTTAALHSYFAVSDLDAVVVDGLGPVYEDKVSGETLNQTDPLRFSERTDRIYPQPEPITTLQDAQWQRTVQLQHHNHSDVVAWNPGAELSRSMQDVPDDGYRHFVCLETARIGQPLVSSADKAGALSLTINVQADQR